MSASVVVLGGERLAKAFGRAPELAQHGLRAGVMEASLFLQREAQENAPVGIGGGAGLKGSIMAQPPAVRADNVIGSVGTSIAHAIPVELGTKPHFPPVTPLAEWARHTLGIPEPEAESVGFLIARAIAKRGTKGTRFMARTFERNAQAAREILDKHVRRILAKLKGGAS